MVSFTYRLYVTNDIFKLYNVTTSDIVFEKTANDFNEKVLPDAVAVLLTAGGGAGGGSSVKSSGVGFISYTGGGGGGGGAGGTVAIILNTKVLKDYSNSFYTICLGHGGKRSSGGTYESTDSAYAFEGGDGEDSYIQLTVPSLNITSKTLFRVGGGKKGTSAHFNNDGVGGSPGNPMTEVYGKGIYW